MKWIDGSTRVPNHYETVIVRRKVSNVGFSAQWDASWKRFRNSNISKQGFEPSEIQWLDESADDIIPELQRRQALILSEPDGIVRETMINNLLINL